MPLIHSRLARCKHKFRVVEVMDFAVSTDENIQRWLLASFIVFTIIIVVVSIAVRRQ